MSQRKVTTNGREKITVPAGLPSQRELDALGIPRRDEGVGRLAHDERIIIWIARTQGHDFVYRLFEVVGEVAAGRMTDAEAIEALQFDYTPPNAPEPRRGQ